MDHDCATISHPDSCGTLNLIKLLYFTPDWKRGLCAIKHTV